MLVLPCTLSCIVYYHNIYTLYLRIIRDMIEEELYTSFSKMNQDLKRRTPKLSQLSVTRRTKIVSKAEL